jgi:hypothetical protein
MSYYKLQINVDIPKNSLNAVELQNLFFSIQQEIMTGPLNFQTGEGYLINKWNNIKSLTSEGKFKLSEIKEDK